MTSRKSDDEQQPDERRVARLAQRVLAERRRDVRALDRDELDRQRAGLEHERESFASPSDAEPGDLRAAAARVDPVRVCAVVDLRVRADLVVEHDREVLLDAERACRGSPRRA